MSDPRRVAAAPLESAQTALLLGAPGALAAELTAAGFAPCPVASLEEGPPPAATVAVIAAEDTLAAAVVSWASDLRVLVPEVPVVAVCGEVRPGETRRALSAGIRGIVLAERLAETLGPCLGAVLAGAVCVPHRQARQVEPATLSAREKQILGMVVMGYMNGEIAERLFVAESTVKSHLSSAFAKLDVRSRNEAVELILDAERGLGIGILGLETEPIAS